MNIMDEKTVCKNANAIIDRMTYANSSINIVKSILSVYEKNEQKILYRDLNFWIAVADNCCYRALSELAKTYDEYKNAVGLRKLMNQAEQTKSTTIKVILQTNLEKYENLTPQREKLKTLRDKGLAHSDKKYATNLQSLVSTYGLSLDEQLVLINTAVEICNDILAEFENGNVRTVVLLLKDDARGVLQDVRIAHAVRKKRRTGSLELDRHLSDKQDVATLHKAGVFYDQL